jgi:hypothetical protein
VATAAQPDTILAWYRRLVARKFDGSPARRVTGRPRIDRDVERLIIRMARENRSWGYDRIVGALANLGHNVSDQTAGNVLPRHGIPPAPERKRTTTWAEFIRSHLALLGTPPGCTCSSGEARSNSTGRRALKPVGGAQRHPSNLEARRPPKLAMSHKQAVAIVNEGLRRGTRRHRSVALGVAAQFEFTIRQIDVIGEWERVEPVKELATDAIVSNAQVWRPGLRFEDFAAGELDLETSKTQAKAIFGVTAYPLFQQALSAVPEGQRRGPLVTDDSGMPVRRRYYQDLYRDVADAAGVPRAVWNMLARHGGATEARQAAVAPADIAEHAQHADLNTTRKHCIVPSVETSRRVAKQRVAHRQAKKNTP